LTTDEHENTVLIFIERATLISLHGVGDAVVVRPQFVIGGHTRMIWCGDPTGRASGRGSRVRVAMAISARLACR